MEVRSSPVVEFPLLFLILSNRSIILSVFDLLISIFLELVSFPPEKINPFGFNAYNQSSKSEVLI